MRRVRLVVPLAAALLGVLAPGAAHARTAPLVQQLVVFRDGSAKVGSVVAARATVGAGRRDCAVGAGTPLAALARSRVAKLSVHDYGSCSANPADGAGLYVKRIRKDAARGVNGWVYKVGNKAATAGAADPTGPFGSGRLRSGARVTWFYCHMGASGCQRTLAVAAKALGGRKARVTVRAFDDRGKARAAAGATVHVGGATATTDSHGDATVTASPGVRKVYAQRKGLVRSYRERIDIT